MYTLTDIPISVHCLYFMFYGQVPEIKRFDLIWMHQGYSVITATDFVRSVARQAVSRACSLTVFIRATLSIARSLLSSGVRLSVRLSRWWNVSTRLKISSHFLFGPVADRCSFFWFHAPISNSKGDPFSGDARYTGVWKFYEFRLKSPFISETVRDRPMVTMGH